jgi:hypothetical protein
VSHSAIHVLTAACSTPNCLPSPRRILRGTGEFRKRYWDTRRPRSLTDNECVIRYIRLSEQAVPVDTAVIDSYGLEFSGAQADISAFTRKPAPPADLLDRTFMCWPNRYSRGETTMSLAWSHCLVTILNSAHPSLPPLLHRSRRKCRGRTPYRLCSKDTCRSRRSSASPGCLGPVGRSCICNPGDDDDLHGDGSGD